MDRNGQNIPPGSVPSLPGAGQAPIRKVLITELKPGMRVVSTGLSWVEYPYLYSKDVRITSERHIQALLKEGFREAFVLEEPEEGAPAPPASRPTPPPAAGARPDREPGRVPAPEEYRKAHTLYQDSQQVIEASLRDVRLGKPMDREASAKLLEGVFDSIEENPDAMVTFINLRAHDDYTFTHSINVAVLCLVFGSYLGLEKNALIHLGEAALFHDLGMLDVPEAIVAKPGRLAPEEFAVVKAHPAAAADLLARQGTAEEVLAPIREHHERYNGSGYPHGLSGEALNLGGQITALGDVYDALTSKRSYRGAVLPNTSMRILFAMRGKDFEQDLVDRFIKCLGIYPVGSMVRLQSGELAMVCGSNPASPLSPTVKIVADKTGKPRPPRIVDLSSPMAAQTEGMAIAEPVAQETLVDDPMGYVF